MIAYFGTSAVVPLLVDEATTALCSRLWNESTRVVSVRLSTPKPRAALAQARRLGKITRSQLAEAVAELDSLVDQIDIIELGADIARISRASSPSNTGCEATTPSTSPPRSPWPTTNSSSSRATPNSPQLPCRRIAVAPYTLRHSHTSATA